MTRGSSRLEEGSSKIEGEEKETCRRRKNDEDEWDESEMREANEGEEQWRVWENRWMRD